jgi:GMP synthase (glutamine-hydrolysing)
VLEIAPSVVILSGGPNSVHAAGSPTVPPGFFEWAAAAKVPVLGICYGMQLLVQCLGGEVAPADKREYGRMPIATQPGSLFAEAGSQMVWMSHGDEAKRLPDGFVCVAKSEQVRRAAQPTAQGFGRRLTPVRTAGRRGGCRVQVAQRVRPAVPPRGA